MVRRLHFPLSAIAVYSICLFSFVYVGPLSVSVCSLLSVSLVDVLKRIPGKYTELTIVNLISTRTTPNGD